MKHSIQSQAMMCISMECNLVGEVLCSHCRKHYCRLCFTIHRKYLITDMKSMWDQMLWNRQQGVTEVMSFIDRQANDAHDQARRLVDDAISRIMKASQNIHTYIENRRVTKLNRMEECLKNFDKDAEQLKSKLVRQIFLPADIILELRHKYVSNMFDTSLSPIECDTTKSKNEDFFDSYRYYYELMQLRQKWPFLESALTTIYFPARKNISLDTVLTFLEYRHDRVLENYQEYLLKKNEKLEGVLLKPTEKPLNERSFPWEKALPNDNDSLSFIRESSIEQFNEAMMASHLITSDNTYDDGIYSDQSQS